MLVTYRRAGDEIKFSGSITGRLIVQKTARGGVTLVFDMPEEVRIAVTEEHREPSALRLRDAQLPPPLRDRVSPNSRSGW
jgi:hypothetical protein